MKFMGRLIAFSLSAIATTVIADECPTIKDNALRLYFGSNTPLKCDPDKAFCWVPLVVSGDENSCVVQYYFGCIDVPPPSEKNPAKAIHVVWFLSRQDSFEFDQANGILFRVPKQSAFADGGFHQSRPYMYKWRSTGAQRKTPFQYDIKIHPTGYPTTTCTAVDPIIRNTD